jgi:glycosyltransferase involved in cell wall biosynthesis
MIEGFKITLITLNTENISEYEINDNIKIFRLPAWNFLDGRFPIPKISFKLFKLLKLINAEQSECFILNQRFYLISFIAFYLSKISDKPLFLIEHVTGHFTVHNKILDFFGHIYEHFISYFIKKNADKFFGVSKAASDWLSHFNISSNGEIYNSIFPEYNLKEDFSIKERYNIPNEAIIFTYAGRLLKEKGILTLIDAFILLQKEYDNIFLILAGDGDLIDFIRKRNQGNNRIILTGRVDYDSSMTLIKSSDIIVIPSNYPEGLPTLILEAGLFAKPVISTNKGGATEVIISDEFGIIIPPDSVKDLKNAMELLLKDNNYANKIGNNLHMRILEYFTWKNASNQLINQL